MASTLRPAVRRITGSIRTATTVAQHLVLVVVADVAATAAHAPLVARVVLGIGCLVGHWRIHRRRH